MYYNINFFFQSTAIKTKMLFLLAENLPSVLFVPDERPYNQLTENHLKEFNGRIITKLLEGRTGESLL